ncbi:hypothetical protein Poli38472_004814 [Pythium oligandrum]|uniref:Ubiquitin-like domain-containing protein n=1 Tax=Pythium oligandrum TaxID=41045 RepID=A0A8K1FDT1_PYTOL|nr:hypothetical protein Poli38472_004814 [Pythium oligandrum]|eukprot:TMW59745.1 hypothetical protein Poli38472_004814 [Pythium oligandrum]
MELSVKVVSGASETLAVRVENHEQATVLTLKQLIEAQNAARFPVAAQRLIFQGQILQNEKLLSDYSIQSGMALHLTITPGVVAQQQAAPAPVAASAPPNPNNGPTLLQGYLQQMRSEAGFDVALQTLQKICENIVSHPTEDKYRKLRVGNAALKARLFDRSRGMDCVRILGFQEGVEEGHVVLVPNAERWENLVACKRVIDQLAAAPPAFGGSTNAFGGVAGAFGGANPLFGGAGNANVAAQAQAMMQNPALMSQMMQSNPMLQQMAQANPMLAQVMQNPSMLAQTMQSMQQNPAMMQQLNQMMQDPNAMQQMQQMMMGGGGAGGFPSVSPFGAPPTGGFPSMSPFGAAPAPSAASNPFAPPSNPFASPSVPTSAPTPTPTSAPSSTPAPPAAAAPSASAAASSDDTFDEDEIAAAIAQSLEEHKE